MNRQPRNTFLNRPKSRSRAIRVTPESRHEAAAAAIVYAAMGEGRREVDEPAAFKTPPRAADPRAGERVFGERCVICHGANGAGLQATPDRADSYVFPPLWGADSFNGAGMHRVLTAARFIKAKMPLGQADQIDDQAFDVPPTSTRSRARSSPTSIVIIPIDETHRRSVRAVCR